MNISRAIRCPLFLLVFLLILSSVLPAQSFLIRTFNENDGLINSSVNDIVQDPSGRMWFATRAGISIYDGAAWTSFSTLNGLTVTSILKIRLDGNGSIWAVGNNPTPMLLRFDGRAWTSFPLPPIEDGLVFIRNLALLTESNGIHAAVGTEKSGVFLFDGLRWDQVSEKQGLAGNSIRGLEASGNAFWAATDKGLSIIRGTSVERGRSFNDPILRRGLRGITVERTPSGEKIWLIGLDWLGTWRENRLEILWPDIPNRFDDTYSSAALLPDRIGGILYGNPFGIHYCYTGTPNALSLGVDSGLIAEGATAFYLDRERNIWVAGLRGLSRISSRRFFNFRKIQGLLEDEVSALQSLGQSSLVFGHNLGLTIWDGGSFKTIDFARPSRATRTETRVLDMAPDGQNGLWIAASGLGLGHLTREGRLSWFDRLPPSSREINSVFFDKNRTLWISGAGRLYQMQNGRVMPVISSALLNTYVRKIFAGPGDAVLMATSSRGLVRWQKGNWDQFSNALESGADNVFAACVDGQGRILVGTMAGLFQVSDGNLVRFGGPEFEIRRPVYLILEDQAGRLWIGTDNGVVVWDGTTKRDFTIREGFAGQEVNRSAGLIDQQGHLWLGTNSGVSCYRKEFDLGPGDIPPPLLSMTGLDVNGRATSFSGGLTLGYRENNLVFHFQGISFLDEAAVRFRSRLDGFDKAWGPEYAAQDRQIRYTNLPPGKYVFNLRAKNSLGVWSEAVSSPEIRIRNPFWQQWWFISLTILLLGGLAVSLTAALVQHRHATRLEAEVRERTAQIQASLHEKEVLLKEIHHRVKNNLQIVSSLLFLQSRKSKDPAVLGHFQSSIGRIRAMAMAHESLYRSEQLSLIGMEDYLRGLARHLLEAYSIRTGWIRVDVQAAGVSLSLETAMTCGLIINELVSNAFKHAFPDDRKGAIMITMEKTPEGRISLCVSDDGVGMPAGMERGKTDSLGLHLVRNLAAQLRGTVDIERHGGTVFRIAFPG